MYIYIYEIILTVQDFKTFLIIRTTLFSEDTQAFLHQNIFCDYSMELHKAIPMSTKIYLDAKVTKYILNYHHNYHHILDLCKVSVLYWMCETGWHPSYFGCVKLVTVFPLFTKYMLTNSNTRQKMSGEDQCQPVKSSAGQSGLFT